MKVFSRTDATVNKMTLQIFRQELAHEKKPFLLASIFIPLQHFLYIVVLPLLISYFTQSLITNPKDTNTPLMLIGGMVAASLFAVLFSRIGFISLFNHQERMTTRLNERALRGLLAHSYSFFANSKVGSLAGDVNTFSRSYLSMLDTLFLQASSVIVNFVTSLIIIAIIAPIMLPVLLVLTFAIVYGALRSYTKRSVYRNERKERMSKLFGNIADILGNQTLVRMFGRSENEINAIAAERKQIEMVAKKEIDILQRGAESRMSVLFLFQIITLLLCLYLSANSLITIAALIFIITYLGRVTGAMFAINGIVRMTEQAFLDASKITEMLNKQPEITDKPNARSLKVNNATIQLNNVLFAYSGSGERPVFKKLNLTIPNGQSVGLVGKSGGGKSTLTHLLLRYMDIADGTITIDGQSIANVTQTSLRSAIAYVPQDPFLFHRSLRDNIAYGKPEATEKEIIDAARKAHALEFIKTLPQGLDTIVGERGVKLSGGQRQRIAIARALVKNAPILILDEATSALDSESEKLIQQALEKLMKNRTSIVVAHRLSTIAKLDRIIVLDAGTIVEDGSHAELLKEDGIYNKLWSHQSGGFIEE